MVNDAIACTIHMTLKLSLPDALAGAVRAEDTNGILPIFHGLANVKDELLKRGSLVAASAFIETGAVVLKSANSGDHWSSSIVLRLVDYAKVRIIDFVYPSALIELRQHDK